MKVNFIDTGWMGRVALCLLCLTAFTGVYGADKDQGRKLFDLRCATCHGLDGRGSIKIAKQLGIVPSRLDLTRGSIPYKSTEELRKLIAEGHGRMPKNRAWLNAGQIKALIQYLRSLQRSYVQDPGVRPRP